MDDILRTFEEEASELLDNCSRLLLKSESAEESFAFPEILRYFHTLKGNAQYLQLGVFVKLIHEIESILVAAQLKEEVSTELISFLLEMVDILLEWNTKVVSKALPEKVPDVVLAKIDSYLNQFSGYRTILLVDDDKQLLETLKASFECKQFGSFEPKLLMAFDGVEAITLAKENKPDLIVTDLKMPKIDGLNFIKLIRNMSHLREVPILFISGYFDLLSTVANQKYFEKVVFIPKPFKMKTIRNYIDLFIGTRA
ncbi:MAG: response regulator [Oligoflexales bacterium]